MLDWDADGSNFDPSALPGIAIPAQAPGSTTYTFADGLLPLDTGSVFLRKDSRTYLQGVQQAGVVGTDLLSEYASTVGYAERTLYRNDKDHFCSPAALAVAGFHPVSGVGYLSNDYGSVQNGLHHQNLTTAPVRIGSAIVWAELEYGRRRRCIPPLCLSQSSVVCKASTANVLLALPDRNIANTTCARDKLGKPITEPLVPYKLIPNTTFSFVTEDGSDLLASADITILLKKTPAEALVCGGIGSRSEPMAQIGASIIGAFHRVIFDPFASRTWFTVP